MPSEPVDMAIMREALHRLHDENAALRVENEELKRLIAAGHSRGAEISPFIRRIFSAASQVNADNYRLREENERLKGALEVSRGQWIHSVNARQCLEALAPFPMTEADKAASERLSGATRRWDRPE